jgi:hypothetical protein
MESSNPFESDIPLAVELAAKQLGFTNVRKSMTKWLGNDKYGKVQFVNDQLIQQIADKIEKIEKNLSSYIN